MVARKRWEKKYKVTHSHEPDLNIMNVVDPKALIVEKMKNNQYGTIGDDNE
jgi:hypothetical protein